MSRKSVLAGLLMATVAAAPAMSQTMDTESSAWSQSVNQNQIIVGGGGGGGTNRQEVDYSGGYTVKSVPDAMAPMIPGGMNPCVVGMSAAGSVVGFGASMGGTWNDQDCERRNLSIILLNASNKFSDPALASAALEILCNNEEVEEAMQLAGRPCLRTQTRPPQSAYAGSNPDLMPASERREQSGSNFSWIDSTTLGR